VSIKRKNILLAMALTLPMLVFFAGYLFGHSPDLIPTGFIQYDNVSYVAYGKQYLDDDHLHLQYSNPFNDHSSAPIYFQPQTILFALLQAVGVPPGWILIPFSLLCAFVCFLLVIALYDHLVPASKFRILHIWLFAWGGGLLTLTGMGAHVYLGQSGSLLDGMFVLDPEHGWWGLNFGRALFFSCEAYYHAVFLGCIYALLKRKWLAGFILLFLLSLSHPFTGIELLGIVFAWCLVEYLLNRKRIPAVFIAGVVFGICFHIYYYLVYLNGFPDHQSVSEQYALNWRLRFYRMIPAYCLVGTLAIFSMFHSNTKNFFQIRANRLFACWFLVAFLLANHEVFMTPRQPVHFTRGYIWTSLFLLGLPALQRLTVYLDARWKKTGIILLCVVFFMDNFLWIFNNVYTKATIPFATYYTEEQKKLLQLLNKESSNKTVIVSSDGTIAYLSAVYTKGYPWYSHPFTTPFSENKRKIQEKLFYSGELDSVWSKREVNFVLRKTDTLARAALLSLPIEKKIQTRDYDIYLYRPAIKH
jgi:hypothetical protein